MLLLKGNSCNFILIFTFCSLAVVTANEDTSYTPAENTGLRKVSLD